MATLYQKHGRRYLPVSDTAAYEGLGNGSWLVVVEKGCRSTIRVADPTPALEQIAAEKRLADLIADAVVRYSMATPARRPLTAREQRAWKAWADAMGPDAVVTLTRPSAREIGERAAEELVKALAKEKADA